MGRIVSEAQGCARRFPQTPYRTGAGRDAVQKRAAISSENGKGVAPNCPTPFLVGMHGKRLGKLHFVGLLACPLAVTGGSVASAVRSRSPLALDMREPYWECGGSALETRWSRNCAKLACPVFPGPKVNGVCRFGRRAVRKLMGCDVISNGGWCRFKQERCYVRWGGWRRFKQGRCCLGGGRCRLEAPCVPDRL